MILILLRLSGYGGTGLRFAFGALQWVDLIYALYAGGPTTFAELLAIVALLFFSRRRGELGSFPPSPTGVPCIVSGYRLIGLLGKTIAFIARKNDRFFVSS